MTPGLGIGGGAATGGTMRLRHLALLFLPWIIFVALRAGEVSAPAAPADGYRGIWFRIKPGNRLHPRGESFAAPIGLVSGSIRVHLCPSVSIRGSTIIARAGARSAPWQSMDCFVAALLAM